MDTKELTREQRASFYVAAEPLIKWLNENTNPHSKVEVTVTSATLTQGLLNFTTNEYLKD